jgi:hypothetical protein
VLAIEHGSILRDFLALIHGATRRQKRNSQAVKTAREDELRGADERGRRIIMGIISMAVTSGVEPILGSDKDESKSSFKAGAL